MRFAGIAIRNFRSLGNVDISLRPWAKCNVLIGQNNSGKSNAMRAVQLATRAVTGQKVTPLDEFDHFQRDTASPCVFRLYLECEAGIDDKLAAALGGEPVWFEFEWHVQTAQPSVRGVSFTEHLASYAQANAIFGLLTGDSLVQSASMTERRRAFESRLKPLWDRFKGFVPEVAIVPEFRRIQRGERYNTDGHGLVELIDSWQDPALGHEALRAKFDQLEGHLRRLFQVPDLTLRFPGGGDELVLDDGPLTLSVDHYGTGLHQVIILLTAAISLDKVICCVEEPEIHLHPRLLRDLAELLASETTNDYLFSTHASTLVDLCVQRDDFELFHLRKSDAATVANRAADQAKALSALDDLGVRPSDVLQANAVLWVEGPSDRIYIRRWLGHVAQDLVEWRDFVIMPYGGSGQLKHVTAGPDQDEGDLVDILRINPRAILVMDSDRASAGEPLDSAKQRIHDAFEKAGARCWVTEGREIENYLTDDVVSATLTERFGKEIALQIGRFARFADTIDAALERKGINGPKYQNHKVEYARLFAQYVTLENMPSGLRAEVQALAERIKAWNR